MRILLSLVFSILLVNVQSQLNYYEKGTKALYWGISLGLNTSSFRIDRQPISAANDTIFSVEGRSQPGFNLGLIGNWQFNKYFDLRIIPNMSFGEKIIEYKTTTSIIENKISTTYLTFPLMLRFKSEPVKDWRLFVIGGIKYEYNIIPQRRTIQEPERFILKKNGLSMEYGIGLQYFFPYFIFSPEIKYSHSIFNMLDGGQSERNNSIIRGLYPSAFTLTLNFEG